MMDWLKLTPEQIVALSLLLAVAALARLRIRRHAKDNGEVSLNGNQGPERRQRSCHLLEGQAEKIGERVTVVESAVQVLHAGLAAVREDQAQERELASTRHGDVMRAIGSITGEIRALRRGDGGGA